MKNASLGLGIGIVAVVGAAFGGACSNDVTVQFGGAGGASNTTSAVTSPTTTGPSMVGSTGVSMVGSTGVSMVGSTGVSMVGSTGVSMDGSTGVSMVGSTGVSMVASSSSGGPVCMPSVNDKPCAVCAKAHCCADVTVCATDTNCACWAFCTGQHPGDPALCFQQCGAPDQDALNRGQCTNMACPNECGGVAPAGSSVAVSSVAASSGSGMDACLPAPNDSACTACSKMNCCNDVQACAPDAKCDCWTSCIGNGGTVQTCFPTCGALDATTNQLFQCAIQQCQGQCP